MNDQLYGDDGNDSIDGGIGNNTAIYDGKASDYAITYNAATSTWTVRDMLTSATGRLSGLINGTDQVKNVQLLYFVDENKTYKLTPNGLQLIHAKTDMNGDGVSDVLLRNVTTNTISTWRINTDGSFTKSTSTALGQDWKIDAKGHFDGNQTTDLYVRNQITGDAQFWFQNSDGTYTITPTFGLATDYAISGAADFDHDGYDDLIYNYRGTYQEVGIWFQKNGSFTGYVGNGWPGFEWKPIDVGDTNGDGTPDILLRNTDDGRVGVWFIRDRNIFETRELPNSVNSQIMGIDDFNGDGTSDILWRDMVTGETYEWIMNNGNVGSIQSQGIVTSDWQIQGTGDFNGDGMVDILWRNTTTGLVGQWLMANGAVTGWTVQGFIAPDIQILNP